MEGRLGGSKLDVGIAAKRQQIEQKTKKTSIGETWAGATREHLTLP